MLNALNVPQYSDEGLSQVPAVKLGYEFYNKKLKNALINFYGQNIFKDKIKGKTPAEIIQIYTNHVCAQLSLFSARQDFIDLLNFFKEIHDKCYRNKVFEEYPDNFELKYYHLTQVTFFEMVTQDFEINLNALPHQQNNIAYNVNVKGLPPVIMPATREGSPKSLNNFSSSTALQGGLTSPSTSSSANIGDLEEWVKAKPQPKSKQQSSASCCIIM